MTASAHDEQDHGLEEACDDPRPVVTPAPEPSPAPPPDPAPLAAANARQTWTAAVARQTATVSSKLSPIARLAGDRIASASPMTLFLGVLGLFAALSIVASLAFDNALGVASAALFVPALSAAFGAVAMRSMDARRTSRALREDALREGAQLRQLERTLHYVDTKLSTGLTQFGSDRHNDAVIAMFQAKAATELYLGSAPDLDSPSDEPTHAGLHNFQPPAALSRGERSERAGLSLI